MQGQFVMLQIADAAGYMHTDRGHSRISFLSLS